MAQTHKTMWLCCTLSEAFDDTVILDANSTPRSKGKAFIPHIPSCCLTEAFALMLSSLQDLLPPLSHCGDPGRLHNRHVFERIWTQSWILRESQRKVLPCGGIHLGIGHLHLGSHCLGRIDWSLVSLSVVIEPLWLQSKLSVGDCCSLLCLSPSRFVRFRFQHSLLLWQPPLSSTCHSFQLHAKCLTTQQETDPSYSISKGQQHDLQTSSIHKLMYRHLLQLP